MLYVRCTIGTCNRGEPVREKAGNWHIVFYHCHYNFLKIIFAGGTAWTGWEATTSWSPNSPEETPFSPSSVNSYFVTNRACWGCHPYINWSFILSMFLIICHTTAGWSPDLWTLFLFYIEFLFYSFKNDSCFFHFRCFCHSAFSELFTDLSPTAFICVNIIYTCKIKYYKMYTLPILKTSSIYMFSLVALYFEIHIK